MGTSYVLPCRDRGFDAVWGPKIEYENRVLDEAQEQFFKEGGYTKKRAHISMDKVVAWFNTSAADLEDDAIVDLAEWLYTPEQKRGMCRLAPSCEKKDGIHLINYSLMSALDHAEYLVFQNLGRIRETRADLAGGQENATEGYRQAVRYVYQLFGMEVERSALYPASECPKTTVVFDECPRTIEEYVEKLWEYCFTHEESTFRALLAFTLYYQADIGNDPLNGWHGFPLVSKDREGDIVTWHIIWRQAWYGAIISQITSMSPIIFSAFVAGVLQ
ncbi:hypothetical protein MMYC01_208129 [Madurella mycetomatis]|uniref:Uncharacterized protein n=1 Tax=Madurella mycetomatis TaxID=100816 RepID=A0A175VXC2_9PEZI|nr:hypothetical protein MMYC01_208129 [Madurella mycetomatis]